MSGPNLHEMEKKILVALYTNDNILIEKLPSITNLAINQARRAIEWLKFKGLVTTFEEEDVRIFIDSGKETKLPERMLIDLMVGRGQMAISIKDFVGFMPFPRQALKCCYTPCDKKWMDNKRKWNYKDQWQLQRTFRSGKAS